jgi:hypothetical protein
MKCALLAVAMLTLLSCTSAHREAPPPGMINVLYSFSVDQNDMLELSLYDPTDQRACTSVLNWPGPAMLGDTLRVVGRDGKKWEYTGPEPSIVGKPQDLRIAPRSEVTTHVDLRKYYKPISSETHIGKVYYGALFQSC